MTKEPIETKDPEATEEPKGIQIHKTDWNAAELAFVLGLRKEFTGDNGQVTYGVTNENVLTSLVGAMIAEYFNKKPTLVTPTGNVLSPFAGGNGNGR
jgi:hypothetical protein